jgi:hypothetical protein
MLASAAKWEDIRVMSTGEVGNDMNERNEAKEHAPKLMKLIITDDGAGAAEVGYMERWGGVRSWTSLRKGKQVKAAGVKILEAKLGNERVGEGYSEWPEKIVINRDC